jgi:hypothetical protein
LTHKPRVPDGIERALNQEFSTLNTLILPRRFFDHRHDAPDVLMGLLWGIGSSLHVPYGLSDFPSELSFTRLNLTVLIPSGGPDEVEHHFLWHASFGEEAFDFPQYL